jgi:hypothetical protein
MPDFYRLKLRYHAHIAKLRLEVFPGALDGCAELAI